MTTAPSDDEIACIAEVKAVIAEHCERAYRAAWSEAHNAMRGGYPGSPTVDQAWYLYKRENLS